MRLNRALFAIGYPAMPPSQTPYIKKDVYLGIDFGTTKTIVSYCGGKKDQIEPNLILLGENGTSNVPTCIYIPNNTLHSIIGTQARNRGWNELERYTHDIKMHLNDKRALIVTDDQSYTAADLTKLYLKEICRQCETYYNIKGTIITHPAKGDAERDELLRKASVEAGFTLVDFITEPEAAAHAYFKENPGEYKKVLVVDWGGGTLDMTLVTIKGERTRPNPQFTRGEILGGNDIDRFLLHLVHEYMTDKGKDEEWDEDKHSQTPWYFSVMDSIRDFKKDLSDSTIPYRQLELFRPNGDAYPVFKLNHSEYIRLIQEPFIDKAVSAVTNLLNDITHEKEEVDVILLCGGTCLIPEVAQSMYKATGLKCITWDKAKEAVSLGAAIRSYTRWAPAPTSPWWKNPFFIGFLIGLAILAILFITIGTLAEFIE